MPYIRASDMSRLCRILEPIDEPDARGSTPPKYRDVGDVWLALKTMTVGELNVGDQVAGIATHQGWTYYTTRITNRSILEIKQDGRRLEVVGLSSLDERDEFLALRLREAVS